MRKFAEAMAERVSKFAEQMPVRDENRSNAASPIKKFDDEQQLVFGEVYAPGFPDSQGDFMSAETIQTMAHEFLRKGLVHSIDTNHNRELSGSYIVESFIARPDDTTFIPGSWVIGVKITDPALWALIKSGELNGFSLDGIANRVESSIELDIPLTLNGETSEAEGHAHTFVVRFSPDGEFLGGETSQGPDGHVHRISHGTTTEVANGHSHRFSFVEGVLNVQDET